MFRDEITADLYDVARKIVKNIQNPSVQKELAHKVKKYIKTKNDRDDLTKKETSMIYRNEDYSRLVDLTKRKKLDIDWSDHAEYRSDLRDLPPEKVSRAITDAMRKKTQPSKGSKPKLKSRGPEKLKSKGLGTLVLDYDLEKSNPEVDVVTLWANEFNNDKNGRIDKMERMVYASINNTADFISAMNGEGLTGTDLLAIVYGITRKAVKDDWILELSAKEAEVAINKQLKNRNVKNNKLRKKIALLLMKDIADQSLAKSGFWGAMAKQIDKRG